MATIIAGRFQQQDVLQQAIEQMEQAGFSEDRYSAIYVNPPGQHARYSLGGDHDNSTGAEHSPEGTAFGAATGGTVGAIAGMAASALLGPAGAVAGALVGAHVGSLVGSLSSMDEADASAPLRHAGLLLAVSVEQAGEEARAIALLRACGAQDIERADGSIVDGDWIDFDPLLAPQLVDQPGLQPPAQQDAPGQQP